VRELATFVPGASTDEMLHTLLASLTAVLGARRAYVTETFDQGMSRTIASWEDGKRGPVREYALSGTPCASVMRHGVQVVDCELGRRYTLAESSIGYGCESFIGSPIVDREGSKIGQICVFGAQPLQDTEMASALVSLAAVRVSAELEHLEQEESLREQRRKLEVLLGNLPGMAYWCEYNGQCRVRFASHGCEKLTGYEAQQLEHKVQRWDELICEEDRERVLDEMRQAVAEDRNYELQYRIRTRDGARKWVWERGCGVSNDDGQTLRLEGFISDATALIESQAALARSEAYSKAIVATAAEGIITLDAEGRIESVNQAAETMFGYGADELIGEDVKILMPEIYREEHTGHIKNYVTRGEGSIFGAGREVPARRKDGSEFPIYLAASEVSVGGERCFAGIIRDISDQKAAEESRKAVEQRFRAVFDQRLQLAGILSVEGRVLEANRKSLDFSGLDRDTVIGQDYWHAPWWSHSPEVQQRIHGAVSAAAAGETVRFEVTCPRRDGQLALLDFSVRPIMNKDGEIVFLVTESHDITEQRLAEEEARQHRARVAHVARLSTLGEMAAGIAHEINQPLTAISLFAQAGRRLVNAGSFERMGEVCDKLNEHALRASEVVERMQTMARQGESVKEVVDCNDLIESAVRLAESEARIYDVQIQFDKGADLAPVCVDGVQIQQVALNLLRNGMEATIGTEEEGEKSVAVRTRMLDGGRIQVSVIDRGCGVPEDFADDLFVPFSTTKDSGMGMGLSISQAIVRAHGGDIGFLTNHDGGTTFWFTLPGTEREGQHE
jgi:two-component system sensor kinase FixL